MPFVTRHPLNLSRYAHVPAGTSGRARVDATLGNQGLPTFLLAGEIRARDTRAVIYCCSPSEYSATSLEFLMADTILGSQGIKFGTKRSLGVGPVEGI
jgi:hypothetical protein